MLFVGIDIAKRNHEASVIAQDGHVVRKAMRFAKSAGATTICITDGDVSPLARYSDIRLFARSDMVSFLDSLVAPLSLINALLVTIGLRSEDQLSDTFKRLETIWSENDVYENASN